MTSPSFPPVEVQSVPGYSKDDKGSVREFQAVRRWKRVLNNTTLTLGCNNIFGQDPPKAYESKAGYADFLYDSTGRFVYISLKKTF